MISQTFKNLLFPAQKQKSNGEILFMYTCFFSMFYSIKLTFALLLMPQKIHLYNVCKNSVTRLLLLFCFIATNQAMAQNSLISGGFGGRLWYNPVPMSAGSASAFAICGDSSELFGWGSDPNGSIGNSLKGSRYPTRIDSLKHVRFMATSANSVVILSDRTAWIWGSRFYNYPVKIMDSVVHAAANFGRINLVKADGSVWSVGANTSGSYGNGYMNNSIGDFWIPSRMLNMDSAVRVAGNINNTAVLRANGDVYTCGRNYFGELGIGSTNTALYSSTPVKVSTLKGIIDLKASDEAFVALDSLGNVYTWGEGNAGQIGNGQNYKAVSPYKIDTLKNIVAISASNNGEHILALDDEFKCWAWGNNYWGQLGTGNRNNTNKPRIIDTNTVDIMAGGFFTYLVKKDGSLWCSGAKYKDGSVWLNLADSISSSFKKLNLLDSKINLCPLPRFTAMHFTYRGPLCAYDSLEFKALLNPWHSNPVWDTGDSSGADTGVFLKHKFRKAGHYKIILSAWNSLSNKRDSMYRLVRVNDASRIPILGNDTSICGKISFKKTPAPFRYMHYYRWHDGNDSFTRSIQNAGEYAIQITDENGCSYKDTFKVISHPFPTPFIGYNAKPVCQYHRLPLRFTDQSVSADSIVERRWIMGSDTLLTDSTILLWHFVKSGPQYARLSLTTNFGCKATHSRFLDVLPGIRADFSIAERDSCLSSNRLRLKNSSVSDRFQDAEFNWTAEQQSFQNTPEPVQYLVFLKQGVQQIKLTALLPNQCTDTFTRSLMVYKAPIADFTQTGLLCSRDSVRLTAVPDSAHQQVRYLWEPDLWTTAEGPRYVQSVKGSGSFPVRLIAVSGQNCRDTAFRIIQIHALPGAKLWVNDTDQCLAGNRFVFRDSSDGISGKTRIDSIYFGDHLPADSGFSLQKTFKSAGTYRVVLLVSNDSGCRDSAVRTVVVRPRPFTEIKVNRPALCEGSDSFLFTYNNPATANASVYHCWINGTDTLEQSSVFRPDLKINGSHTVRLAVRSEWGCSDTGVKTVRIHPLPMLRHKVNSTAQCLSGNRFIFTDQSVVQGSGVREIIWHSKDDASDTSVPVFVKSFNRTGLFQILHTAISDSACTDSNTIVVEVFPQPKILVQKHAPVCAGSAVQFKNLSYIDSGYIAFFEWEFGDQFKSSERDPLHTYQEAGLYNVSLSATSDRACKTTQMFPGLLRVHPTPAASFNFDLEESDVDYNKLTLKNTSLPANSDAFWDFGVLGTALKDTSFRIADTLTVQFLLTVTDSNGCKDSVYGRIFVFGPLKLFIPNAFSPERNGINDRFEAVSNIPLMHTDMKIYNRWGEQMYMSSDLKDAWDGSYAGRDCPSGVYVYVFDVTDLLGNKHLLRGTFTLIR